MCSTPFGITEFRGVRIDSWKSPAHVLNAFRHHGVSRFLAENGHLGFSHVLNAFRHHGVSRSFSSYVDVQFGKCSTPFGITEFRGW